MKFAYIVQMYRYRIDSRTASDCCIWRYQLSLHLKKSFKKKRKYLNSLGNIFFSIPFQWIPVKERTDDHFSPVCPFGFNRNHSSMWYSLFADFLSANSLIHISKLVKYDKFLVKNGLCICKFRIRGPKWRNVSTANNERNMYIRDVDSTLVKVEDSHCTICLNLFNV